MPKRRSARVRRTFTPQFKKDAVEMVRQGKTVTEVSNSLGVARSLLQYWKRQLEEEAGDPFPGRDNVSSDGEDVRALKKKLKDVTEERDILKNALLRGRPEVKFRFVQEHRETFPVGKMCEVLKVSRSGFYAWFKRQPSRRILEDEVIAEQVRAVHRESRRIYGSPRVYRELRKRGESWGRHRIARIMREEGLQARCMKQFHWISTTRSEYPAAPDLLERKFFASKRDRVWVGDITQIRTGEGWLYLAMLMDMYSRRIVGWSTSKNPKQEIALEALEMAIQNRRPRSGLIHHTDRGGQYSSGAYQNRLDELGVVCSMSRPGQCLDNAAAETFFHTLKTEWIYHGHYKTRREVRLSIFEYIEGFYNTIRMHCG